MSLLAPLLSALLMQKPKADLSVAEMAEYDRLFEQAIETGENISRPGSWPIYRFIDYICNKHDLLVHGSNRPDIIEFEPRRQTLYNGKWTESVFATADGIWATFYAVFDRSKLQGNFRNGCLCTGRQRFYFFSVTKETFFTNPWTSGIIYFLPKASFEKAGRGPIHFDEWVSHTPVKPVTRVSIQPEDFESLSEVSIHDPHEPPWKTIVSYKSRCKRRNPIA
jgi:hypothetical protein